MPYFPVVELPDGMIDAVVALILMTVRVRSSSVCHAAWTTVLLAMMLMPVLPYLIPSVLIPIPVPAAAIRAETKIPEPARPPDAMLCSDVIPVPIREIRQESSFTPRPEPRARWLSKAVLRHLGRMGLETRAHKNNR
jgi:hypothetical protein